MTSSEFSRNNVVNLIHVPKEGILVVNSKLTSFA